MSHRAKAYLVDSDTIVKWVIRSGADQLGLPSGRAILEYSEIPTDASLFCSPFSEADVRFYMDLTRDQLPEEDRPGFEERAEAMLFSWFRERINRVNLSDAVIECWLKLCRTGGFHEGVNREHLWNVAIAEGLTKDRFDVTIVCEEPHLYQSIQDQGYLQDISIATKSG